MEEKWKLHDREYEFACIVWEQEPIGSGDLAKVCEERLGWKRTTTYTVLKKLCDRGILRNEHAVVSAIVKKEMVQRVESRRLVEKVFDNSISHLVASFAKERSLSEQEIAELRALIDSYEEKGR